MNSVNKYLNSKCVLNEIIARTKYTLDNQNKSIYILYDLIVMLVIVSKDDSLI